MSSHSKFELIEYFLKTGHFKIEDYKTDNQLLTDNCSMYSVDLTDAYYMISIVEPIESFYVLSFSANLMNSTFCLLV